MSNSKGVFGKMRMAGNMARDVDPTRQRITGAAQVGRYEPFLRDLAVRLVPPPQG
ncbi:hypothetical protein ACWD4G_30540 [Streptomyces sp. NPDC002643]